jgi:hypothetical protein
MWAAGMLLHAAVYSQADRLGRLLQRLRAESVYLVRGLLQQRLPGLRHLRPWRAFAGARRVHELRQGLQ